MKAAVKLTIAAWTMAVSMAACQPNQGPAEAHPATEPPPTEAGLTPQGAELLRLAQHPNVAIVLALVDHIYQAKEGILSSTPQKVSMEIRRVTWVGSRLLNNFWPTLKKGYTGGYWAYNRGGKGFTRSFGTKAFPLDSFRVGKTYWFAITSGMSIGRHIVTWEEAAGAAAQSQPSKNR